MSERDYIDLPDEHYGVVAFAWPVMFSEKKGLLSRHYTPVQLGHYHWREFGAAAIDRRLICPTLDHYTFIEHFGAEWLIDVEDAVFVPPEALPGWVDKNRAYHVRDALAQQAELRLLATHYTTPESH